MGKRIKEIVYYRIYKRSSEGHGKGRSINVFDNRGHAVFWCKTNQTLPLPNYEWDDEFEIREFRKPVP